MSHFHNAEIEVEGRVLTFSIDEGQSEENSGNYWHGPGDPSTWLAVAVFQAVRRKYELIGNAPALELAAQNLGITVGKLLASIDWHEHYMQWHDGDADYRVL